MNFKKTIALLILPFVRFWIRYFPTPLFKNFFWKKFSWLSYNFSVRTKFGSWIQGCSSDLIQGYIYYFGVWEPNLTHWMRLRLKGKQNRTFIDVGANIGYYTLLAAKELGFHSHVVAIEASPVIYEMLLSNVKKNKFQNVRSVCCAATAQKSRLTLYHAGKGNIGATTTINSNANITDAILVDGLPLCEILTEEELSQIRLVKIDVEGAEKSVIDGLLPVFERLPQDVEFCIETSLSNFSTLFEIFTKRGFSAYALDNSYEIVDYLFPKSYSRPKRIDAIPAKQVDVIFSKIHEEYL